MRTFPALLWLAPVLSAALLAQQAPPAGGALQATVSAQTGYDNNINDNNQAPLAAWEQDLDAHLSLHRVGPSRTWRFDYHPYLQLFTSAPRLDSLNQVGAASADLHPSARWTVNLRASGGYLQELPANSLNGLQPILAPQVNTVAPRLQEETGQGEVALAYALTPRTTVAVNGGYRALRFPGANASTSFLNGVRGSQSGASLAFQATPQTQLGLRAGYQNFDVGPASHLAATSVVLSWAYALSPATHWQLEAGPEYTQVHDTLTLGVGVGTLVARLYRVRTYPRLDGTLSHQGDGVRWQLQASRQVSDGGGALPFPVALLDGRLQGGPAHSGRWRLRAGLHLSQLTALASGALGGRVRMAAIGIQAERQLDRHLVLGLNYSYLLQRSQGAFPLLPAVNRDRAAVRLNWSWRPLPNPNQ